MLGRLPVATSRCDPTTSCGLPSQRIRMKIPPLRLSTRYSPVSIQTSMPSFFRISVIASAMSSSSRERILPLRCHDRDAASKAPEHLAKLERDVTAAQDHEVFSGRKSTSMMLELVR